jgi:hypothetical protein
LFERQWVVRDFRKTAGLPAEEWLEALKRLEQGLQGEGALIIPPLDRLAGYYHHLGELAKGYEKDPVKLQENLSHVYGWKEEVEALARALGDSGE